MTHHACILFYTHHRYLVLYTLCVFALIINLSALHVQELAVKVLALSKYYTASVIFFKNFNSFYMLIVSAYIRHALINNWGINSLLNKHYVI